MWDTPSNITTFPLWFRYVNTVSEGAFGYGLAIAFFAIPFLTFLTGGYEANRAASAASFIAGVLCILWWGMGLIPLYVAIIYIVACAGITLTIKNP